MAQGENRKVGKGGEWMIEMGSGNLIDMVS